MNENYFRRILITLLAVVAVVLIGNGFIKQSGIEDKVLASEGMTSIDGKYYTIEEAKQMQARETAKLENKKAEKEKELVDVKNVLVANGISEEDSDFLANALCNTVHMEDMAEANGHMSANLKEGSKEKQCEISFKIINGEMADAEIESPHLFNFSSANTLRSAIAMIQDYEFVFNADSIKNVEKTSYGYKVEFEGSRGSREGSSVVCIYTDEDNNITAIEQEITAYNNSVDSVSDVIFRFDDIKFKES